MYVYAAPIAVSMTENDKLQMFEDQAIRTAWDEETEEWYFSIVDVVKALTEQATVRGASNYWAKLKERLKGEGASELLTNCQQLKMKAADGKRRLTDVANTEQLLRIIQSIPSKKAEPFKMWLAMVGRERIEEIIDPELTIDRALDTYAQKGYPPESSAVGRGALLLQPQPTRAAKSCTTIMTALPTTTPRKAVFSTPRFYCRPKPRQRGKTAKPCGRR